MKNADHNKKLQAFAREVAEEIAGEIKGGCGDWESLVMFLFMGQGEMISEKNGFCFGVDATHNADGSYNRKSSDWKLFRWAAKKALEKALEKASV